MGMEFQKIILTVEDGIARLRLNTPHNFNALTSAMMEEFIAAMDLCEQDSSVRVIIISGEGKAFCSGGDIKYMRTLFGEDGSVDSSRFTNDLRKTGDGARRIRRARAPVIAAIHGSAAGAGCNLALLCDFKIASQEVRFIQAFVNVGLIPDMGGTYILSRYVGLSRLNEAMMLGKPIPADEALALGMVNSVVPRESLETAATELAKRLKAMPALSLAKMKRLVNLSLFSGLDTVLEAEEEYQTLCASGGDFREGVEAFLDKRKPDFGGGQ